MIISEEIMIHLREVGVVLHIAKSGRVIIKLDQNAKIGPNDLLHDSKGRKIAKVVELIGPVRAPYASALPMTDRITKYIGTKIYGKERSGERRRRRRR